MDTDLLRNRPAYTLDRETAPAMWLVGTLWLVHATGIQTSNRSSFLEQVMPRGLGPPTHRHPLAVEGFYVLEGVVSFHVDGGTVRAEAGTLIHLPRMIPHTFTVESDGSVGVTALPFAVQPTEALLVTRPGVWRAGTLKVATPQDAPAFEAFGLHWRLLAASVDTENTYDLFEVAAPAGAGMPARVLGADEAIYVNEGAVTAESDGRSLGGGPGSFTYAPAGSVLSWRTAAAARLLVFHFPGGFDRAVAGGRGEDALAAAWLEAMGTRFLAVMPLAPPA